MPGPGRERLGGAGIHPGAASPCRHDGSPWARQVDGERSRTHDPPRAPSAVGTSLRRSTRSIAIGPSSSARHRRDARQARRRARRADPGQDAGAGDRRAAARRPAARSATASRSSRPDACTCASPAARGPARRRSRSRMAELLHRARLPAQGPRWSASPATTSSGSTSGTRRRRPRKCSSGPWAGCCSSTRPTTCTGRRTSATTAQEAIEILLQVMEAQRDDLVVILAGYARPDGHLLPVEPRYGLAHRPPHRVP